MQIAMLGPLQVRDGDQVVQIAGPRLRRLLVRLAVDANRQVFSTALSEAVWPTDRPADAVNSLQSLISRLRRVLGGAAMIEQLPGGYRLAVDPSAVDVQRFVELARHGRESLRRGETREARSTLLEAEQLWRGAPLVDADDADYAAATVAKLTEVHLDAISDRIEAEIELGNADRVITELEALAAEHQLRERFAALLVTALARTGRTAEAMAAYERLRRYLRDELGADPGANLQRLHLQLLRGELGGSAEPQNAREQGDRSGQTNLRAPLTSFIGREEELERVSALLRTSRLTTIVGPGGAGKTRLSTEVATTALSGFADGVWMVELAPVTEAANIPQAMLGSLGLRAAKILDRSTDRQQARDATERLISALQQAECLLVIDNCEHLIQAAATLVHQLLAACPALRILATSREPLGIVGEALCAIPPLGLPPDDVSAAEAMSYPAVQLLVERAEAVSGDFQVNDATVGAVTEIVRRLDGLPLAIELATARLRVLPIAEIAARLSDRFRLLSGGNRTSVPRHRTLRAVVEWSWDLLTPAEQLLAERLSVFPAGATTQTAVAICADERLAGDDIPELLLALVDKSLLQVVDESGLRFRMLETIREYGVERLAERGEGDRARAAHATYFADLAAELEPVLRSREQLDALRTLGVERDNILAALRYFCDSGAGGAALDLVLSLIWYWIMIGSHSESHTWLELALEATRGQETPARAFADGARLIASVSSGFDDPSKRWEDIQAEMALVSKRLDPLQLPMPTLVAVKPSLAFFTGDEQRGMELMEEALRSGDAWTRAALLSMRTAFSENNGDVAQMRLDVDAAHDAFRQIGDRWGQLSVLNARGLIRTMDGDLTGALEDFNQVLQFVQEIGSTDDNMLVHLRLADLKHRLHDLAGARQHLEALRGGPSGGPLSSERFLFADVAALNLSAAEGDLHEANRLAAELRVKVAQRPSTHPLQGHVASMVGTTTAALALRQGDIESARVDLEEAYPQALSTLDMPIVAAFAVSEAHLAQAVGCDREAAVILGAAASLRGGDDPTEPQIAALTVRLRTTLGTEFDSAYAEGKALSRETALTRIDPGRLPNESDKQIGD